MMEVDVRIGEGGLLRRFETAAHLTRVGRQILTAIAITWVPIMLFGLIHEHVSGQPEPVLHRAATHVRLLVAAPVFLFIDQVFPTSCRIIVAHLVFKRFIPEDAEARFERTLQSASRLANSWIPETLLLVLSIGLGIGALIGVVPAVGVPVHADRTAAQIWYTLTDWPFVQFLLWRSLWRWIVWVRVLIGIARIRLVLVPTHPDRRAGISFLRLPSVGYCALLLFAIASMLCAEWGDRLTFGASIAGFTPLIALFVGVGAVIAFGPLLAFAPQLFLARRRGILDCGGRACDEGRLFQKRVSQARASDDRAAAIEVSALSDVGVVYREAVDRLNIVLVDRRDLLALLTATLLPVLPMMLIRIPFDEWRSVASLITGGKI